jgi:hypothetical protein
MMRRFRLVIGVFVVGLSTVAILGVAVKKGLSRESAVVDAFFLAVIYAGIQLLRANWRNEREHEEKLTRLLDQTRAQTRAAREQPPSDGAGGADPGDQPR